MRNLLTFLIITLFSFSPLLAKTVYIKSFRVFPLEQPKYGSKKMQKLVRGTKVEQVDKQKNWVKIRFNQGEGWVSRFTVSSKKPGKRVSMFSKKTKLAKKARRRASTFTSAAAARGLVNAGDKNISRRQLPDYKALEKLEQKEVSVQKAVEFLFNSPQNDA